MTAINVKCKQNESGFELKSDIGWIIGNGRMFMETNRGISRPLAKSREKLGILHQMHCRRLTANAVEIRQSAQNLDRTTLQIKRIVMLDGLLELAGSAWSIMHSELFKEERYFGGYSVYTGNLLAGLRGGYAGEFGLSEDTPFPGIFFCHPERGHVLMAALTQDRCKPCWQIKAGAQAVHITASDYFSGIPSIPVLPNATFTSERWLIMVGRDDLQSGIDRYFNMLRRHLHFYGAQSALREEAVWGSWNYNPRPKGHGDIDARYVLANAMALKKHFKKVRWIMLDDGYQRLKPASAGCKGSFFHNYKGIEIFDPTLPTPHEPARFPRGMAHMAGQIRGLGLKPAIWCTPEIATTSPLAQKHPEWLLVLEKGRRFASPCAFLDYSIPEVRAFTRQAWDTIFNQWGYAGLKLDFWTYPFEIPGPVYRHHDKTAVELRNLFLADIRAVVPADGFLLSCCTTNAGNPFIGRYADASRIGPDIGDGHWPALQGAASWLSAASMFYRGDCLLADADSIGWCPKLSEDENRLWATVALFTGGMCEIGGDMTRLTPDARRLLDMAVRFFKPVRRVTNSILAGGTGNLPANTWTLERPDGIYEAEINWQEYPRRIPVQGSINLWSGQRLPDNGLLPKHSAVITDKG